MSKTPQPVVAFVVGHENWGKSHTLFALKRICGSRRTQWYVTISGVRFRVRSQSNDDRPIPYVSFMQSFSGRYLVAALCPKFLKLKNYADPDEPIERVLKGLRRRRYRLAFWVIKHRWSNPARFISTEEISELRRYGKVGVFEGIRQPDRLMATRFRAFILRVL